MTSERKLTINVNKSERKQKTKTKNKKTYNFTEQVSMNDFVAMICLSVSLSVCLSVSLSFSLILQFWTLNSIAGNITYRCHQVHHWDQLFIFYTISI